MPYMSCCYLIFLAIVFIIFPILFSCGFNTTNFYVKKTKITSRPRTATYIAFKGYAEITDISIYHLVLAYK